MATSNTYIPRDTSLDTSDSDNTANFLPNIYKSDANKKFLHSTINQLTQPGTVKKVNGYIGRLSAKATTSEDIFVNALTRNRQNYQLEPGMVINDDMGNTLFLKDYLDYINQLRIMGAEVSDHSRLNYQEFYSWDPHIDWDKFVNFQDYYWLPNGPDVIDIRNSILPVDSTYAVELDKTGVDVAFVITPDGLTRNPTITLYRGFTYEFNVNTPNHKFSIKTTKSIGAVNRYSPVVNNAITSGVLTLEIPFNSPDILYYVSENKTGINAGGTIRILDNTDHTYINVEDEILGKKFYTLPNGTSLSNGMCVSFSGDVYPEKYANGKFHVAGVGDEIELIADKDLEIVSSYTTSETILFEATPFDSTPFGNANSYATNMDYIVINRASADKNQWSRYNKWVHKTVIEQSSAFNNVVPNLDQSYRAVRPIIEFNKNLKLFNCGTTAIPNVSLIDNFTSDVFSIIEGSLGYSVEGIPLTSGQRIIFTADPDPLVTNNIYRVEFIDVEHTTNGLGKSNSQQIRLVLESTPEYSQVVLVTDGMWSQGKMYWFNGYTWTLAQQKTSVNQSPLFDVFDENGYSFGEVSEYNGSTFNGTSIFTYKIGTGTNDPKLGFPLSYKNINNIGDIVFNFTLINDTFQYESSNITQAKKIDTGFLFNYKTHEFLNGWITGQFGYHQPAVRIYRNSNKTNNFDIDIFDTLPNLSDMEVRVYLNGIRISKQNIEYVNGIEISNLDNWSIQSTNVTPAGVTVPLQYHQIVFRNPIKLTDIVTIKVFSGNTINTNGHYEVPINLQHNPLNGTLVEFTLGEVIDHVDSIVDNIYLGQQNIHFKGMFPGVSNLRDLGKISQYGTKFVQHSGPMSLSMYHITSNNNIIKAIEKSRDDYAKFKRLFVTVATTLGVYTEPKEHVDLILNELNADTPNTAPYYFSDMIPYGACTTTRFTVRDPEVKIFSLEKSFSLDVMSTSAVLIYLNGDQLLHGKQYTFNTQGFVELTANLVIGDEVVIYEYDNTDGCLIPETPTKLGIWPKFTPMIYKDTTLTTPRWMIQGHDGSLSLIYGYVDEETQSLRLDYRDMLILELETRIYNNIKVKYDPSIFDIHNVIPGYNRYNSGYTLQDFNKVLLTSYYQWATNIKQDFSTFLTQDKYNSFTFNYGTHYTLDNQASPGYWRGIFQWMYDTDRPHLCPWEMLGFSEEPLWWQEVYGPAPYTSNNKVMWSDISAGLVKEPNVGVVELLNYVKPYLLDYLPVDESGNLRSPHDSGIVTGRIVETMQGDFKFGDISPVEAAWRRSSYYPFSVIKTAILLRPSKTLGTILDRSRIKRNLNGQLVYSDTGVRINLSDIKVPSIYLSKTRVQTAGVINYLINNIDCTQLTQYNQYKTDLKTLSAQLCYRVSGFTSKEKFKLLLDSRSPSSSSSNIFIPQEDYKVVLNVSSPLSVMVYSGLIITRVEGGFDIKGYSKTQPYFTYYTSSVVGSYVTIGGVSAAYSIWAANQYYLKDRYVKYNGQYYNTNVSHYSTDFFEPNYFTILLNLPIVGGERVEFKQTWDKEEHVLLYGSKLQSIQAVVDFIVGYGRWLTDQGFIFDQFDTDAGLVSNWESSAKAFVFWSTSNWGVYQPVWSNWVPDVTVYRDDIVSYNGEYYRALETSTDSVFNQAKYVLLAGLDTDGNSVLQLSPAATSLTFTTLYSTVDDTSSPHYSYEVFDVNGDPISLARLSAYRTDNTVSYTTKTDSHIFCAAFYLVQKEHVVLINNTTMFNDTIYNPESGYKQDKVKVAGYVSSDWNGSVNVPGFIVDTAEVYEWLPWKDYVLGDVVKHRTFYYSATTAVAGSETFDETYWVKLDKVPTPKLLPNWNYKATQFTDFYSLDSDNFDIGQQKMAQHLIGYQKRQYLENIIQDDVSEFKFYQGMIVEKGTQNVLNKLFDVLSADDKESLTFYEEWAIRTGSYGASSAFNTIEFKLDEANFRVNPQGFELINNINAKERDRIIRLMPYDVYVKPVGYNTSIWKEDTRQTQLLRPCGHVRENEVSLIVRSLDELVGKTAAINTGEYAWCTFEGASWNVYQLVESNFTFKNFSVDTNHNLAVFTTTQPHLLDTTKDYYIQLIDTAEHPKTVYDRIFYKANYVNDNQFSINVEKSPVLDNDAVALVHAKMFESRRYETKNDVDYTPAVSDLIWTDNFNDTDSQWTTWEYQPGEWLVLHKRSARPDITRVKQAFLYNKVTNQLVTNLDIVDSANGKNPIIADFEVKYKAFYDPAIYNIGSDSTSTTVDPDIAWTTDQVGTLWWDLRTAKFINSYENDVVYRNATWSKLAYGASIDVYEWVESKLLPSAWDEEADTEAGLADGISGLSLYGDSFYSQTKRYDTVSQRYTYTYYFWVKNKITLPNITSRKHSAADVAGLIGNPRGEGYAFLALTGLNSFSLVNVKPYLHHDDVVLTIEYWNNDKIDQNIHSQWKLISNNARTILPSNIEQKWFDSLVGYDMQGREVPDNQLPFKLKYGIENRPRQSMFVNRCEVLKQFIEEANTILQKHLIVDTRNLSNLLTYDSYPNINRGLYDTIIDTDLELRLTVAKSYIKPVITPVIVDGRITNINIENPGRGYLVAPFAIINGAGTGAVLRLTIGSTGEIAGCEIINSGEGYTDTTSISIRNYAVLILSDSTSNNDWSIYEYDRTTESWYKVLMKSFDTRRYWDYVDWYDTGYNEYTPIRYSVGTYEHLYEIPAKIGEIVHVRVTNSSRWVLLEKYANVNSNDWTQSYKIIGSQNGTIQFSSLLYDYINTSIGYEGFFYDQGVYDNGPLEEIRIILQSLKDDIFIDDLKSEYLNLFFTCVRAAFSEQTYVDWIFKTSFVNAMHNVGSMHQQVTYQNDNLSNFEDFVNEVKPYRTQVREYVSLYDTVDTSSMLITDFDVPADSNLFVYEDKIVSSDPIAGTLYPTKNWYDHVGFSVTSIKVLNGGSGYKKEPTVTIESSSGKNAIARAYIANGKVSRITIVKEGSGYLTIPTIILDGGLSSDGVAATAIAILGNSVVRSNLIQMKFDRINSDYVYNDLYCSETFTGIGPVQFRLRWAPDIRVGRSSVYVNGLMQLRDTYTLKVDTVKTADGYDSYVGSITFKTAPVGDIVIFYLKDVNLLTAVDRIQYYYTPFPGDLGKDLSQLMTGVEYGGVTVSSLNFNKSVGWGSDPFYTDAWDSFKPTIDDYQVTVSQNTYEINLPYTPTLGSTLNIYYSYQFNTEFDTDGKSLSYSFLKYEKIPDVTLYKVIETSAVATTGDNLLQLVTTNQIKVGDVVSTINHSVWTTKLTLLSTSSTHNYLTVKSTVVLYVNMSLFFTGKPIGNLVTNHIYYVREIHSATEFTISSTIGGAEVPVTTASGIMSIIVGEFKFDTTVVAIDEPNNIVVLSDTVSTLIPAQTEIKFSRPLVKHQDYTSLSRTKIVLKKQIKVGMVLQLSGKREIIRLDDSNFGSNLVTNLSAIMLPYIADGVSSTITIPSSYVDVTGVVKQFVVNDGDIFIVRNSTSSGAETEYDIDTAISGGNFSANSAAGLTSSEIIVDGSSFVNQDVDAGPEEVVPGQVADAVAIKVYDSNTSGSYMQFKDMLNRTHFKRLSETKKTNLAIRLLQTDETITVVDASTFDLPAPEQNRPGVIDINGERIEFFTINGNVLGQLRRGTLGTGIPDEHELNSIVQEISAGENIPIQDKILINQYEADGTNYLDISVSPVKSNNWKIKTTQLAAVLFDTDSTIVVTDASIFKLEPNMPGVIKIHGEKIEFYTINGNVLGDLRRGVDNTAIQSVHAEHSVVQNITTESFGQCDNIEVIVNGVTLKKTPYTIHDININATSPLGDVQYDADFSVDGKSKRIRLTNAVPAGTLITVIKRTGTSWDIPTYAAIIDRFLSAVPGSQRIN